MKRKRRKRKKKDKAEKGATLANKIRKRLKSSRKQNETKYLIANWTPKSKHSTKEDTEKMTLEIEKNIETRIDLLSNEKQIKDEEILIKCLLGSKNLIHTLQKEIDRLSQERDITKEKLERNHTDELTEIVKYYFNNNTLNYFSLPFNEKGVTLIDKKMCK